MKKEIQIYSNNNIEPFKNIPEKIKNFNSNKFKTLQTLVNFNNEFELEKTSDEKSNSDEIHTGCYVITQPYIRYCIFKNVPGIVKHFDPYEHETPTALVKFYTKFGVVETYIEESMLKKCKKSKKVLDKISNNSSLNNNFISIDDYVEKTMREWSKGQEYFSIRQKSRNDNHAHIYIDHEKKMINVKVDEMNAFINGDVEDFIKTMDFLNLVKQFHISNFKEFKIKFSHDELSWKFNIHTHI